MNNAAVNWEQIAQELAPIEVITEPQQITKLSLDYYHFSPVLAAQLAHKRANLVVRPKTEAEVLKVARSCVQNRIPLTIRGAGTGNYGQCIPLAGGIVLDLSLLTQIHWLKSGIICVEPGVKLAAIDKRSRPEGWELRMYPSTYRTATIGGFIGGGSCGLGSINYGMLSDRGNLNAVQIVTLEDEPSIIELRGDAVQQVNHAYGTNGIITQLEIPLAPTYDWTEYIVTFDSLEAAVNFGQKLGDSVGIVKKLVSVFSASIGQYFTVLQAFLPPEKAFVLLMIAPLSHVPFQDLVREFNGTITYQKTAQAASKGTSLSEFTWNHTTLLARSIDPNLTYLQVFYFTVDRVLALAEKFRDRVQIHLEFLRVGGNVIPAGLPLFTYTNTAALNDLIAAHIACGASIANPHVYTIEAGSGGGHFNPAQLAFKQQVDPYGLLNPGKMQSWVS